MKKEETKRGPGKPKKIHGPQKTYSIRVDEWVHDALLKIGSDKMYFTLKRIATIWRRKDA